MKFVTIDSQIKFTGFQSKVLPEAIKNLKTSLLISPFYFKIQFVSILTDDCQISCRSNGIGVFCRPNLTLKLSIIVERCILNA